MLNRLHGASLLALAGALLFAPGAAQAQADSKIDAPLTNSGDKSSGNPPAAAPSTGDATTATPPSSGSQLDAPLADSRDQTSGNPPADSAAGSGLDTLEPAEAADTAVATPAPTGDPVLDRLNALEAKVAALEARNRQLESQAAEATTRIEKVEVRSAHSVQMAAAPTFADAGDNFTFKPRGFFQVDYAGYNERAGGYDYNNGTDIRRGRFGFDGTAFKVFKWRIEAEFVKNTVNLLDAYVQYTGAKNLVLTVGQHKAPYGLEANSSDAFNSFLERGMANTAFGAVGAERRVGASVAYQSDRLNAQLGFYGVGEGVQRSTNPNRPDEGYGFNGRITFDPVLDTGRLIHVGASAYRATNFGQSGASNGNSLTIADRPNIRVDGGNIVSATIPGSEPATGAAGSRTGVKYATYWGAEAAGVYGPFSVQGEYSHLSLDRFGAASTVDFDGFYVFGSFFVTGESRAFKNGVVDRLKPFKNFGGGGTGAIELLVRYDQLDLTDHGLSPLERKATSWTGGATWYLNPNTKVLFNYIRFKGTNSPLVVAPVALNGTTAKGDAFATRLQFDF